MAYLKEIQMLSEISSRYDVQVVNEKLERLIDQIHNFRSKVLFVGGFSAGKSALLNSLLQRESELLAEAITPQTAIATELVYDTEEYAEVFADKTTERLSVNDERLALNMECKKMIYHLKNDFLKEYEQFVFVDMPGFDSGNGGHDKAISQYAAENGNVYIVCINCEDGVIRGSVAEGLREICNYAKNLAVAITKSDKLTEETLKQVFKSVTDSAEMLFGENVNVAITTSRDDSAREKIKALLDGFHSEELLKQSIFFDLLESCELLSSALKAVRKDSDNDNADNDRNLKKILNEKKNIQRLFDVEQRKLKNRLYNHAKTEILKEVEEVLKSNIASFIHSAKGGKEALSNAVSQVLRPALISSVQNNVGEEVSVFIKQIDISESFPSAFDTGVYADDIGKELSHVMEKVKALPSIVRIGGTIGALMTKLSGPLGVLLDAVLIFLPEILGDVFKRYQEKQIEETILYTVIPQIISHIIPSIDEVLNEVEAEVIEELKNKFQEQMEAAEETIQKIQTVKAENEQKYQELLNGIEDDLKNIADIEESVQNG